jgi:hypothetical protein
LRTVVLAIRVARGCLIRATIDLALIGGVTAKNSPYLSGLASVKLALVSLIATDLALLYVCPLLLTRRVTVVLYESRESGARVIGAIYSGRADSQVGACICIAGRLLIRTSLLASCFASTRTVLRLANRGNGANQKYEHAETARGNEVLRELHVISSLNERSW